MPLVPDISLRPPRIALLFALVSGAIGYAHSGEQVVTSRQEDSFFRLAESMAAAGEDRRQDFAWIAVSEVTRAYEKALEDSAAERPKNEKARLKLIQWRHATRIFTNDLHRVLDLLSTSAEISVHPEAKGLVMVLVDEMPIIISGPELNTTALMRRRIVDTYCNLHDCQELFLSAASVQPERKPVGKGTWVLDNRKRVRYETPDGLVFVFSGLSERSEKQRLCENIAGELRTLVANLRDAKRAGYSIDWEELAVSPLRGSDDSHVRLNKQGDYLRLSLPYLQRNDALKDPAFSWVRTQVEDNPPPALIIRADNLKHEEKTRQP